MLKVDGLDNAIIGQACIWRDKTRHDVLAYSCDKITDILMTRDGMTQEEAHEFIEYNIEGAYMGNHTPVFVWDYIDEETP
jgi:hypothetical protein